MILYELTRWWAYRRIRHPKMRMYTTILPAVVGAGMTVVFLALPCPPPLVGDPGLVGAVLDVLALLPGFYIAALAAVSTFQRSAMDEVMPKPAPIIDMKFEGEWIDVKLTRRMFLSYLFSYLAVSTLLLVAAGYCIILVYPSLNSFTEELKSTIYGGYMIIFTKAVFVFLLFFWCGSIFISTLHGIYFMTERMHQPN